MRYTHHIRFYQEGQASVDPVTGIMQPASSETIWSGAADVQDGYYSLLKNTAGDVVLDADARVFLPPYASIPTTDTLCESNGQKGRVVSSSTFNDEVYIKWQ